jgi:hypothetical protein
MSRPRRSLAVTSSLLASFRYTRDATLELTFRSGAIYHYVAVPATVVDGFVAARSKGTYFNRYIRSHFRFQRVA